MNHGRFIILADESANWEIAGLRQLERIAFELDESAKLRSTDCKIDILVFWRPDIPTEKRWRPDKPTLTRANILDVSEPALTGVRVLNTRLLCKRRGLEQFFQDSRSIDLGSAALDRTALWQELWCQFEAVSIGSAASREDAPWRYVAKPDDISNCERWLLRASGKSRDGFVSRYLNRPISCTVSQFLLKTSMTPNLWTVLITAFPLIGFLFLIRGTYPGFVIGALLFNVHSILDGCDGEIARAKYLDSEKGPGIDAFGDLIALLLFSIGLGFGLFRSAQQHAVSQWVFLSEGVLTCALIALRLVPDHALDLLRRGPAAVVSTQNDQRLRQSGGRIFGDRFTSWAFELTKRDVVFLAFLIASVLGLARWILHLLFVYALVTWLLSWRGRVGRETMA